MNRVEDITDGPTVLASYSYDDLSRREGVAYNGVTGATVSFGYEKDDALNALNHLFTGPDLTYSFTSNMVHQVTNPRGRLRGSHHTILTIPLPTCPQKIRHRAP